MDALFAFTLDISLSFRAIAYTGEKWAYYIHYVLHAPFQIWLSKLLGWKQYSEAVGEALHKMFKEAGTHTTRGGAAGRGYKTTSSDGGLLVNRDQRVRHKEIFYQYQVVRRYLASIYLQNMQAIHWMKTFSTLQNEPAIQFFQVHPKKDRKKLNHPSHGNNPGELILPWVVRMRAGTPDQGGESRGQTSVTSAAEPQQQQQTQTLVPTPGNFFV